MSSVPDNAPQRKFTHLQSNMNELMIINVPTTVDFNFLIADCPGTQSDDAGKASACAGCPNQNICASGKLPRNCITEGHRI